MDAKHITWLGSVAVAWAATAALVTTSACGGSDRDGEDVAKRGSPVIILPVPDPCILDPSLCNPTSTTSTAVAANDPADSSDDGNDGDTSTGTDDGDTNTGTDDGDTGTDDGDTGTDADSGDDSGDYGDDSGDYGDDGGDDGGGDDF